MCGCGAVLEDRAGSGAAYVEQGADGGCSGAGAGVFEDADGVGGAGEPGCLVGEVGEGGCGQVPVVGLVGGVDGGLPVALGVGVAVGVEAEPKPARWARLAATVCRRRPWGRVWRSWAMSSIAVCRCASMSAGTGEPSPMGIALSSLARCSSHSSSSASMP